MKHLFTTLFLVFTLAASFAQTSIQTITGVVFDSDNEPAPFATVLVTSAVDSSMVKAGYTDENGAFEIPVNQGGSYIVNIQYVGYNTYISPEQIDVIAQSVDLGEIRLEPASQQLEEVVVRGIKPMIEIQPDKTVFNVENSVNASGSNALELLRKSPGVVVDNNDNINLLGKTGVQVYIDGKRSPLGSEDLALYLQSVQSDEIASIEIITNPSARYEAEGNAGIINILFKKDKSLGANASVSAGYTQGELARYNGSGRLNYRNKDFNIYGSYSANLGDNKSFFNAARRQQGSLYESKTENITDYTNHNFRAGLDYFINERSTIGALFSGYDSDLNMKSNSTTNIYFDEMAGLDQILMADNRMKGGRNNFNYNLNYRYNGDAGRSLNVDVDYGRFDNINQTDQPNIYTDEDGNIIGRNDNYFETPTVIDINTAKIDYEFQALGGQFGVGGKYSNVVTDNIFDFFQVQDDNLIKDLDRSNEFEYTENVNAGYISYQKGGQKWGFNAGFRVENTTSEGILTSTQQVENEVKRSYTDLFPSAGITYNLNQKNSFRLSYSRRIDRPNYQDLNPFEFKLNELAFRKGNPFLNPQYSNNFQLSHTFNYKLNTTVSYSITNDLITNLTDTLNLPDGREAGYISLLNLDEQRTFSVNVSYPFSPARWWSVYGNVSFINTQNQAEFEPGKLVDINVNTLSVYNQHSFTLPKGFKLELSGVYNSPSVWGGNFRTEKYWFVDIGIQRKFLNDQLNVKLAVGDVFRSQRYFASNSFGVLDINVNGGFDSRQLRLNMSYNFGNQQVKASRQRNTGLEDEKNRLGTSGGQ